MIEIPKCKSDQVNSEPFNLPIPARVSISYPTKSLREPFIKACLPFLYFAFICSVLMWTNPLISVSGQPSLSRLTPRFKFSAWLSNLALIFSFVFQIFLGSMLLAIPTYPSV